MKNATTSTFSANPSNTELTKLKASRPLPVWLRGKLIRNGPAMFNLRDTTLQHWFDGYGMLHSFLFDDGDVYYQSRYTESEEYLNATSSGRVSTVAWGTASDPCRSIFRRFMANFSATPTNTNVNVIKIGEKYFTTSDIATLTQFDVDSLETLSTFTPGKGGVMAAHPSYTDDLQVWNMTASFGPRTKNTFVSLSDDLTSQKHSSFATDKLFYFHSFGNTDRYLIAIEQPMRLDFGKLALSGPKNKSFYECFNWDTSFKNIFHIYDRQTGEIQKIQSDLSFFFFHTINSFEEDGSIVIDLCGYDDNKIVDDFYIDNLTTSGIPDSHKSSLRRIRLGLGESSASMEDFKINIELPNINDAYRNRQHRYAYGVHSPALNTHLAAEIVKYDFDKNSATYWSEAGMTVGEPIFVANPNGKKEDDGTLIVLCHSTATNKAELMVLDAADLSVISKASLPQAIPPPLHGWFYGGKFQKNSPETK